MFEFTNKKVSIIFLTGVELCQRYNTQLNQMPVDGIYRNTPERKALFEAKSHVHGNRTVREDRFLGVTVDEQLKWQTYINKRCKTVTRFFFSSCFKSKPNNKPRSPTSLFLHIHYVAHNLCFKCMG